MNYNNNNFLLQETLFYSKKIRGFYIKKIVIYPFVFKKAHQPLAHRPKPACREGQEHHGQSHQVHS